MMGIKFIIVVSVIHCIFFLIPRFLFLLLGPHGNGPQYHEIGRSIATLMTDEVRERAKKHFKTASKMI